MSTKETSPRIFYYEFPIGVVGIAEKDNAICRVYFGKAKTPDNYVEHETPILTKAASQLREYFDGKRQMFDLPFSYQGTDFQRAAWQALQNIPFGETRSYLDMANEIGNPKACRAVGMANNKNPLAIFIPCHRVINSGGGLCGYAGGIDTKKHLLKLEGVEI